MEMLGGCAGCGKVVTNPAISQMEAVWLKNEEGGCYWHMMCIKAAGKYRPGLPRSASNLGAQPAHAPASDEARRDRAGSDRASREEEQRKRSDSNARREADARAHEEYRARADSIGRREQAQGSVSQESLADNAFARYGLKKRSNSNLGEGSRSQEEVPQPATTEWDTSDISKGRDMAPPRDIHHAELSRGEHPQAIEASVLPQQAVRIPLPEDDSERSDEHERERARQEEREREAAARREFERVDRSKAAAHLRSEGDEIKDSPDVPHTHKMAVQRLYETYDGETHVKSDFEIHMSSRSKSGAMTFAASEKGAATFNYQARLNENFHLPLRGAKAYLIVMDGELEALASDGTSARLRTGDSIVLESSKARMIAHRPCTYAWIEA